jgi:hypothetical protein
LNCLPYKVCSPRKDRSFYSVEERSGSTVLFGYYFAVHTIIREEEAMSVVYINLCNINKYSDKTTSILGPRPIISGGWIRGNWLIYCGILG